MNILIAEKSDIIRTGIRYILHELDKNLIVRDVGESNKFLKTLDRENPYIVFLNPNFISEKDNFYLKKSGKIIFIALENSETYNEKESFFSEKINLSTSKSKIAEILRKYYLQEEKTLHKKKENTELSNRERDVVKEIALGLTNKEIAEKLFLSVHTIVTHRKNITRKLGIKTTSGLTVYAIINNLIEIN